MRDGDADGGSSYGLWPGKALFDLGHLESRGGRTRWGRERGYERKRSRLSPEWLGVESWHYNLKEDGLRVEKGWGESKEISRKKTITSILCELSANPSADSE